MVRLKILVLFGLVIISVSKHCDARLASMSIDLGNQYTKIALVTPGVPMEIVLNRESQRKTDTQVGIRGDHRYFGDSANNMRIRYPQQIYGYLVDLLGKKFDHPSVHLYQKRFPYYKLVPDQNRGTVLFANADGIFYSVEELLGMIIADARKLASKFADQQVKDAVITVPAYFNQAERRAMVEAAEIGGVHLLQLMNDNTAAGVNYGMFRRKQFNETSTKIMIYDMGALRTTATLYEYAIVLDKISREKNPQMTILGVGFDRTLGGLEITLRLRDHLATIFQETNKKKLKSDIKQDPRAMNKLLKEAERVKKVLSANLEHSAQVESLFEDIDMKIPLSRTSIEDLIVDILPLVDIPITKALEMAELKIDDLDYIVLMGGGTRLPKVQETLQKTVGSKELSKFLNTDEAIAMGAVYQAAHRSKGFKVKKFVIKDCNLYPIVVDFEKDPTPIETDQKSDETQEDADKVPAKEENKKSDQSPSSSSEKKFIRRTLFNLKNQYPQKRKMTFSKHSHDFEFVVNYGDLSHLSPEQIEHFGELNISRIFLSGVSEAVKKQTAIEGTIYKGAKAHFRMDESGILQLESADVSFDKTGPAIELDEAATSTFKKLGQKISSFFSGSSPESDKKESADQTENKTEGAESTSKDEQQPPETDTQNKDAQKNETLSQNVTVNGTGTVVPEKPKIVQKEVPLKVETSFMDIYHLSKDQMKESSDRLKSFETIEKKKLDLAKAQNDLESYLIDIKYKMLDDPLFSKAADDKEKEELAKLGQEISEWLEEQGAGTEKKEFDSRLKIIKDASKNLLYKVEESKQRPNAVDALKKVLNYTTIFLAGMKNFTDGDQAIFTQVELITVEKLINETQKWFDEKQIEQSKLATNVVPALTVQSMIEKSNALEREVNYLISKAKFAKPKPKKEKFTTASNETDTNNNTQTKANKEKEEKKTYIDKDGQEIPQASDELKEDSAKNEEEQEDTNDEERRKDQDKPEHHQEL